MDIDETILEGRQPDKMLYKNPQPGVGKFLDTLNEYGYNILYLTNRPIEASHGTRERRLVSVIIQIKPKNLIFHYRIYIYILREY